VVPAASKALKVSCTGQLGKKHPGTWAEGSAEGCNLGVACELGEGREDFVLAILFPLKEKKVKLT
jgi:hypothetical protein